MLKYNTLLICFSLIVCLSIWQFISGPGPPVYFLVVTSTPSPTRSPLAANALSEQNASYEYPMHQLPGSDYHQLIDFDGFEFTMLNTPCNESAPMLLVLVHSAPENAGRRAVIRRTWGQRMPHVHMLFAFGRTDERNQRQLDAENDAYGDCIQGNFNDSYVNVTYKHAMVFKYALYHCPSAKYVLKTDDDVFVNLATYLEVLNEPATSRGAHDVLFCNVRLAPRVNRSYRSKWRVPIREYGQQNFPDMCPGWALLYSRDVLFRLYVELQRTPYFWIDDVVVTGILREKIHLPLMDNQEWVVLRKVMDAGLDELEARIASKPFLYGPSDTSAAEIHLLWNLTRKHVRSKHFHYAFDHHHPSNVSVVIGDGAL